MIGKKIKQTKSAINTILNELRLDQDYFTIVTFSENVSTWHLQEKIILKAEKDTVRKAIEFIYAIEPSGETMSYLLLFRALLYNTIIYSKMIM